MNEKVDKLIRDAGAAPPVDRSKRTLSNGEPIMEGYDELRSDGQQKGYVVLSEDERRRGFVRPVRHTYQHVGSPGHKYPLRPLTDKEHEDYDKFGYIWYEEYPNGNGRFWTQAMLDRVNAGCGGVTTMGVAIAETYARDPKFYGGTFCVHCAAHFPVGEFGEFVWDGTEIRVGT